jgi:hypothetical protein
MQPSMQNCSNIEGQLCRSFAVTLANLKVEIILYEQVRLIAEPNEPPFNYFNFELEQN